QRERAQRRLTSQPPAAAAAVSRASVPGSGTATAKTTPLPLAPPINVVPYRVPPERVRSPKGGVAPGGPKNEARTVGVPPPSGREKTVPWLLAPPLTVVP